MWGDTVGESDEAEGVDGSSTADESRDSVIPPPPGGSPSPQAESRTEPVRIAAHGSTGEPTPPSTADSPRLTASAETLTPTGPPASIPPPPGAAPSPVPPPGVPENLPGPSPRSTSHSAVGRRDINSASRPVWTDPWTLAEDWIGTAAAFLIAAIAAFLIVQAVA